MNRTLHKLAVVAMACLVMAPGLAAAEDPAPPARVEWGALSADQQQVLERFRGDWEQMPPGRQQAMLHGAERWLSMTPEQQARARERWEKWQSLPPEERQQVQAALAALPGSFAGAARGTAQRLRPVQGPAAREARGTAAALARDVARGAAADA